MSCVCVWFMYSYKCPSGEWVSIGNIQNIMNCIVRQVYSILFFLSLRLLPHDLFFVSIHLFIIRRFISNSTKTQRSENFYRSNKTKTKTNREKTWDTKNIHQTNLVLLINQLNFSLLFLLWLGARFDGIFCRLVFSLFLRRIYFIWFRFVFVCITITYRLARREKEREREEDRGGERERDVNMIRTKSCISINNNSSCVRVHVCTW